MVGACVFVMGLLGHCTKKLTPENFGKTTKTTGIMMVAELLPPLCETPFNSEHQKEGERALNKSTVHTWDCMWADD